MMVNAQCEGHITLARVRNADGKSFKFTNEPKLAKLGKNDGLVVEISSAVEKGNYIVPVDYKIIDTHISGKKLDMDEYMDSLAKSEPANTPPF